MNYTKSQQQVLDTHQTNLLVSASAGSGKTRVLVDRVINMILAHESLENLLIVTFTRAAAAEMKDRIETALRQQISVADASEQRYLSRQLAVLPVADISTLDAFCQKIVERYYYLIDLDPVFRILGDQSESDLLKDEVWNDVREQLYQNDDDGAFKQLVTNFSNDRSDDGLTDQVMQVFQFMGAKPDPGAWLKTLAAPYQVDGPLMASSIVQQQVLPLISQQLDTAKQELQQGRELADGVNIDKAVAYMDDLLISLSEFHMDELSWDGLRQGLNEFPWGRLPSIGKKSAEYDDYQDIKGTFVAHRDNAKKALETAANLMPLPEEATAEAMNNSRGIVAELAAVVQQFATAYDAEKRRRHIWEFSDIEHFALQILQAPAPEAIAVRKQLSKDYHEIMVDEYQDTNELQEAIVTTLAHEHPGNLFMVGDIKQSIYRFRLAEPKLFIDKFNRYQADPDAGKEITLAENFRSMKNVDEFTNLIFTQIMDEQLGQIKYAGSAKLVYGANYPDNLPNVASLMIYDTEAPSDAGADDAPDGDEGQVTLIAQKIRELLAKNTQIWDRSEQQLRPLKYEDIAIISSTKKNNLEIQDQFGRADIPVQINDAQSYFKTTEVQIMMSMLQIIDNPYQDIPLAAVLRSPIVGLNENELAYLRINDKSDDYYSALLHFYQGYQDEYAGNHYADELYPKIQKFLEQLQQFQTTARQKQLATLIWQIYQTTGFLDYVAGMPAGPQRQANLHALYERAADYEQNGFKGLFQFVRFIERMQRNDHDLAEAKTRATENAVQVMTIHGSKGLEFPVVFLLNASKKFNMQDLTDHAVLNNQLGIGIDYFDPEKRVAAPTLPKLVIQAATRKEALAEEMRKLYVALTRAEQRLYIVGACKGQDNLIKGWSAANHDDSLVLNPNLREKTQNFLDWIGLALMRHPQFKLNPEKKVLPALKDDETQFELNFYSADDLVNMGPRSKPTTGKIWLQDLKKQVQSADYTEVNVDEIDQLMEFHYQHQAETQTTAYQSVSEIKRLFEDPDIKQLGDFQPNWQTAQGGNRFVTHELAQPDFMQTINAPTSAEIGTATHLIFQEIDLAQPIDLKAVQAVIDRLVDQKVMQPAVADRIKQDQVVNFFKSEFGQTILQHQASLKRETPFSLLLPAKDAFTTVDDADAKILIHGIIDGYFVTEDGITLFDYKTDYLQPTEAGIEKVKHRYEGQLRLYALALEKMLQKPVVNKYLYLLSIDQLVQV
ncbi:helicase-exonuclease AddAB subunit AddA [Secundilactobacillus hailunensis]|uniref:ATP-dependent helicase/nuclease subunit A n=1 Tax=Secundilactobacillus hailunensis TaxID=2559923 RepID=A0ABW1TA49_9LACO|nr:helicase-exonuclease AddAB subunit AddA [Secundilactobacillus hailunensis]